MNDVEKILAGLARSCAPIEASDQTTRVTQEQVCQSIGVRLNTIDKRQGQLHTLPHVRGRAQETRGEEPTLHTPKNLECSMKVVHE
jgi:hypothetical protein